MLGSVAMRDKMIDVENAIKLANDDGCVTFEEIRCELKKCDFSNAEIEMFFGNSDTNGDGIIDVEESNDTLEDLEDGPLLLPPYNPKLQKNHKSDSLYSSAFNVRYNEVVVSLTSNKDINNNSDLFQQRCFRHLDSHNPKTCFDL